MWNWCSSVLVWLLDLGFFGAFLMSFGMLGASSILFGSICLETFWTFFLGLSMDFIFFILFFLFEHPGDL